MTHTAGRATSVRWVNSYARKGPMSRQSLTNSRTYANSGAFVVADVHSKMSRHLNLITLTRLYIEWRRFTITRY